MHILIAEDDADIAGLIARYLTKAGWSPHVTSAGDEALAYLRSHPVDVIVLDLMLPGLNGLDVCRAIRADRATAALPVIMLTARTDEADRVKGLDLGPLFIHGTDPGNGARYNRTDNQFITVTVVQVLWVDDHI